MESRKGENVVILDVRGISSVTDFYVLATGNNTPHIKALANELDRALAAGGVRAYRRAGTPESHWLVNDYFDVVVHIFSADLREYYALERLWADAKRVE